MLILAAKNTFIDQVGKSTNQLSSAKEKFDIAKTKVNTLQATKNSLTGKIHRKSGRNITISKKKLDVDALKKVNLELSDVKVDMKAM